MKTTCLSLLLWGITTFLFAQNTWDISGRVFDETGAPVSGASIASDGNVQARSAAAGRFSLACPTRPRTLSIRCVGYFAQRIQLDSVAFRNRTAHLDIRLISSAESLPEIAVSSKPVETIFEEDFATNLLDYAFAGKNLLMLVREKKRYYLRLATDDGQKLSEIAIPGTPSFLHKSCTGNFHAVAEDWVWEAALRDTHIDTFPRYPTAKFHQLVEPCVLELDGNYIFQKTGPFRRSIQYTLFDTAHHKIPFALIRDKAGETLLLKQYRGILHEYMKTIPDVDRDDILDNLTSFTDPMQAGNLNQLVKMAETNELVAEVGFFHQNVEDSLFAPLVRLGPAVYLLDHLNGKLMRATLSPISSSVCPLTYHQAPRWKKEIMTDQVLKRIYGRFTGKDDDVVFREINLETGNAGKAYRITTLPRISDHFKIRNGTLYCLVQPDVTNPNKKLWKVNLFKFEE